jgi:hypothetical protein
MSVFTTRSGTKILATERSGVPHVEAYHLADRLGYSQSHSIRKQVLSDWQPIFEEGTDYKMVHDEGEIRAYEHQYEQEIGAIKPIKATRGRMFLSPSGLSKVFGHTSKDSRELRLALDFLKQPTGTGGAGSNDHDHGNGSEVSRERQYEILETLLDHLKDLTDPGLRRLALMSAELGLGRQLPDIRALLGLEHQSPPSGPPPASSGAKDPGPSSSVSVKETVLTWDDRNKAARDYLARRPITQGPLFSSSPAYYALKQIGDLAGGYTAKQAGKAADIVAGRMGYSHDEIRRRQLPFNELPVLPDSTSGKPRRMYRFNSHFANHVVNELRANKQFVPAKPRNLGPFSQGGNLLPKLSRGPFES